MEESFVLLLTARRTASLSAPNKTFSTVNLLLVQRGLVEEKFPTGGLEARTGGDRLTAERLTSFREASGLTNQHAKCN